MILIIATLLLLVIALIALYTSINVSPKPDRHLYTPLLPKERSSNTSPADMMEQGIPCPSKEDMSLAPKGLMSDLDVIEEHRHGRLGW